VLGAIVAVCVAVYLIHSLSWPLVNDAVLLRYATFLRQHHFAPYCQILDYNLPGSYFADWLVVHTLGASAFAWRVYDLSLLAISCASMYLMVRLYDGFAGFYAAAGFALFHARNGIAQAGQRDLAMAALILAGAAILLYRPRKSSVTATFFFGLCIGAASTIKPTAILAMPLALLPLFEKGETRDALGVRARPGRIVAAALAGMLIAPMAALVWLGAHHATASFWMIVSQLVPLHERLGYLGFWALFTRIFTAAHGAVALLAIFLMLRCRDAKLNRLRLFLIVGMGAGFLSYFVQAKGYPYHRYLFVAFLFLFASLEFSHALRWPGYRRIVAAGGLVFLAVLGVLSTVRSVRDRWPVEPVQSLARDLNSLGGATLSGDVQCIDTIDSCLATLYRLRLVQSTGMMYDEFLFVAPDSVRPRQAAALTELRHNFLAELASHPPRVLIVTPWLFPAGPDHYAKLDRWLAFEQFVAGCYEFRMQRDFPSSPREHPGYRLYVRRQTVCALPLQTTSADSIP
jgi:hypothetical protein